MRRPFSFSFYQRAHLSHLLFTFFVLFSVLFFFVLVFLPRFLYLFRTVSRASRACRTPTFRFTLAASTARAHGRFVEHQLINVEFCRSALHAKLVAPRSRHIDIDAMSIKIDIPAVPAECSRFVVSEKLNISRVQSSRQTRFLPALPFPCEAYNIHPYIVVFHSVAVDVSDLEEKLARRCKLYIVADWLRRSNADDFLTI